MPTYDHVHAAWPYPYCMTMYAAYGHGHGHWRNIDINLRLGRFNSWKTRGQKSCDTAPLIAGDGSRETNKINTTSVFGNTIFLCVIFFVTFIKLYYFVSLSFVSFPRNESFAKHEISRKGLFIPLNNETRFASVSRNYAKLNFVGYPKPR
jgi:hypothetical protein